MTAKIVAMSLACCVLFLSFATTSPVLHEALHNIPCCQDKDSAPLEHDVDPENAEFEHLCVVSILQKGLILGLTLELPTIESIRGIKRIESDAPRLAQIKTWSYSSRAPPAENVV